MLVFGLTVAIVDQERRSARFAFSSVLIAYALYYFWQVVLVKLLDLAGLLSTPALWTAYLLTAAAAVAVYYHRRTDGIVFSRRYFLQPVRDRGLAEQIVLGSAAATVIGLAVLSLIAPTHIWDVQAYHMPMVASYVQNESLALWPTQDLRQIYRVNGAELQMLNLALLSRSDAWMELPNVLALAVSLIAVFELARHVFQRTAPAYAAVALVLTAPQILVGSVTAKNDIIFLALILSAFYLTIRLADDPASKLRQRVVMLALIGSLAVATKVIGLNIAGTIGLVLLVLVIRKRLRLRPVLLFGILTAVGVLILVGDVYWSNLNRTQVPVGIMPGEVHFTIGPANLIGAAKFYVFDLSFRRLVIPQVYEHDFSHYGYFFPFMLVLGSAAGIRQLFVRRRRNERLHVLVLLALVLFVSVILVRQPIQWDQRFMIWLVPVLGILTVSLFERWDDARWLVLVSFGCAFGLANVMQIYTNESGSIFARSASHLFKEGELPRLVDVRHEKYDYKISGFDVLEAGASRSDSVLYIGAEDTWMYPAWGRSFTRHVSGVRDAMDVDVRVNSRVYRFIVVEDDAAEELKQAALRAGTRAGYAELYDGAERKILVREFMHTPRPDGQMVGGQPD